MQYSDTGMVSTGFLKSIRSPFVHPMIQRTFGPRRKTARPQSASA